MKKKIVHIGMPYTGVGSYINQVFKYANQDKFEFYLLCNLKQDGVKQDKTNLKNVKHIHLKRSLNPFLDLRCLTQIIALLFKIKPSLVHCHSSKAGLLARLAATILNIPTFYTPNAFAFLNTKSKLSSRAYLFVERIMAKFPGKLLACSQKELEIGTNIVWFKKNKSFVWTNSIYPLEKEYNFSLKETIKDKSIASVGRVCFQKNFDMAVDVMKIIKEKGYKLKLNIYGAGYYSPEKEALITKIKSLDLEKEIIIYDYMDRSKMAKMLTKSMLYISTARYEGLPYSIMEAMSLALPSIVTDVEGNNELIINEKNGYLIDRASPEKMANKIIELIDDDDKRQRFGQKAYQIFSEKYNIESNIKKLENLYQQHGR